MNKCKLFLAMSIALYPCLIQAHTPNSDITITPVTHTTPQSVNTSMETPTEKPVKETTPQAKEFVSHESDESLDGDIIKFQTDVYGITSTKTGDPACIPKGTRVRVKDNADPERLLINYKRNPFGLIHGESNCRTNGQPINRYSQYSIKRNLLNDYNHIHRSWAYGALVVPFKYYMGGDRRITSSSTIAPYIGYSGMEIAGMKFTPIFSAGLGLVPVNQASTDDAGITMTSMDTKSALSTSIGVILTSNKNKAFSAGFLIGRDFLGNTDRRIDPTVDKYWLSVYAGIALGK